MLTTQYIIEKGYELNNKHSEYKNSSGKTKAEKWKEYITSCEEYRKEVKEYLKTNPIDVSDSL